MVLYIIIFAVLFIFSLLDLTSVNKIKKPIFWFFVIFFITLSGLRWRTGGDWAPYTVYFDLFQLGSFFSTTAFEPGYMIMTYITKDLLGGGFTLQLFAIATAAVLGRSIFFKKYTPSFIFALLLFWGNNMSEIFGTRQAMAISLALLGVPYIVDRKPLKFLLVVIIAMQFHVTSIAFLMAYPVYQLKWSTNIKIVLLVVSIIVGLSGVVTASLEALSSFGLGRLGEKAGDYAGLGPEESLGTNRAAALAAGIAKRIIILPILLYFENHMSDERLQFRYRKFMNIFIFGNVLYFLVISYLPMHRVAGYFYPFEIVLLCMIVDSLSGYKKKLWFFIFSAYAFVKLLFIIYGSILYIDPYYWIFSESFGREAGTNF